MASGNEVKHGCHPGSGQRCLTHYRACMVTATFPFFCNASPAGDVDILYVPLYSVLLCCIP